MKAMSRIFQLRCRLADALETLDAQAHELAEWNHQLEQRVAEGVARIERLDRLRRFFSPAVADLLLTGEADDPLRPRRRDIVVMFLDLRGYTEFTEIQGPDEVMRVLGEFHAAMGRLITSYSGTLERFTGDGRLLQRPPGNPGSGLARCAHGDGHAGRVRRVADDLARTWL